MKILSPMKIMPLFISIVVAGCAGTSGENVLGAVDSGLATVGSSAETGRAAIAAGKTAAADVPASQTALTNVLVSQLGVTPQQALGGAGAIFQAAKANMTQQAFSTLSQSVPGMSNMLAAAPQISQPLSGATSLLGQTGSALNTMTSLAASFRQLNLSPTMVDQFIPVVVNYIQTTSGQMTANLLQSALTPH